MHVIPTPLILRTIFVEVQCLHILDKITQIPTPLILRTIFVEVQCLHIFDKITQIPTPLILRVFCNGPEAGRPTWLRLGLRSDIWRSLSQHPAQSAAVFKVAQT